MMVCGTSCAYAKGAVLINTWKLSFGNTTFTWDINTFTIIFHHDLGIPGPDSNACGSLKGTEINHSRDGFQEQRLLYCM